MFHESIYLFNMILQVIWISNLIIRTFMPFFNRYRIFSNGSWVYQSSAVVHSNKYCIYIYCYIIQMLLCTARNNAEKVLLSMCRRFFTPSPNTSLASKWTTTGANCSNKSSTNMQWRCVCLGRLLIFIYSSWIFFLSGFFFMLVFLFL